MDDVKTNLRSANKYIKNLGNASNVYAFGSALTKTIDVTLPAIDAIFLRSTLSVDNDDGVIKKIPLGSVNAISYLGGFDITANGKTVTRFLTFKVTDGYGNIIDLGGATLSFRLALDY